MPPGDGLQARQRMQQPLPQAPGSHGRAGAIEHGQQGSLELAVARGLDEFEVAPRLGIEMQVVVQHDGANAREGDRLGALRLARVHEDLVDGLARERAILQAERFQAPDPEGLAQAVLERLGGEPFRGHGGGGRLQRKNLVPAITERGPPAACGRPSPGCRFEGLAREGHQELAGLDPGQFGPQLVFALALRGDQFARRQIAVGQAEAVLPAGDGREEVVPAIGDQASLDDGPGRHDPYDLPTNESLRLPGVLHLLADGDAEAALDESGQVVLDGVMRYARHRHAAILAGVSARERQLELACREYGILEEELVEVSHPVEQQPLGMLVLEGAVMGQHGGIRRAHGSIVSSAGTASCWRASGRPGLPGPGSDGSS